MKIAFNLLLIIGLLSCKSNYEENKDEYTIPQETVTKAQDQSSESYKRGKEIYGDFCITCHLANGKGITGTFPPLDGSNWLTEKRKESIHAVKYGLQGPIEVNGQKYNMAMAPLGLADQEVADVMNYVMNSWSNSSKNPVTLEEVKAIEK